MAILCVAAGVGTLLNHYPILLSTMTIVGACYLFWMGISLLIRPLFQMRLNKISHLNLLNHG
jgi:threonine/homoserine/homoserine lactone efflux protein